MFPWNRSLQFYETDFIQLVSFMYDRRKLLDEFALLKVWYTEPTLWHKLNDLFKLIKRISTDSLHN